MTSNCGSQEKPFEDVGPLEMDRNDGKCSDREGEGLDGGGRASTNLGK